MKDYHLVKNKNLVKIADKSFKNNTYTLIIFHKKHTHFLSAITETPSLILKKGILFFHSDRLLTREGIESYLGFKHKKKGVRQMTLPVY